MDNLNTIANELGAALKAHGFMLALAESCTGGMVAEVVTSVAGSSAWFERGFVTYSNAAKQEMLGVSENTLTTFSAVSEKTALEMAVGALRLSHAQIAASITGVAGPDGGTESKPVGTVCFGFAIANKPPDMQTMTQTMHFTGNRADIRRQSVAHALETLIALTLSGNL